MQRYADAGSQLILDDSLAPILVATWIGPATLPLVASFHTFVEAAAERSIAANQPTILVNDGSAAGAPNAAVRKAFAEHVIPGEFKTYVVVTNALIRGAMTAVSWLVGDRFDAITCKSLPEALEQAAAFARGRGMTPPPAAAMADYRVEV